jgi:branched-chain amino acid transport system permease protein
MGTFLAQMTNGVIVGSTYALLVTGLNLMLLVVGILQYAYPHLVVLSMYIYWYALKATGNNLVISISLTIISGIVLSLLTEPLFRSTVKRGSGGLSSFMIALGIAMIINYLQNQRLHDGHPIGFPIEALGGTSLIRAGLISISTGQLFTLVGSVAAVGSFLFLLYKSKHGRAFRAIAQSPSTARLLGIPIVKTTLLSYIIAGFLGGITAVFLAMAITAAGPGLSDMLALKIFAIALFAGLGNLKGGLISSFIIGVIESLSLGYISAGRWVEAIVFGAIILVVILKPEGLFGTRE